MLNKVLPPTSLLATVFFSTVLFAAASPTPTPSNMAFGNIGQTNTELQNVHHAGRLLLKRIKVNDTTLVNGYLEVIESNLNQNTTVNGQLDAKDTNFNALTVNGDSDLKNVAVHGTANLNGKVTADKTAFDNTLAINGYLKAKDSIFNGAVTLNNTVADFENCTIHNLTVTKNAANGVQNLNLKNTKVLGKIIFESNKGVVHQDSSSSVTTLIGGTIAQ